MTDTQKPEALRLHRELLYLAAKNAGMAKERMFAALTKSAAELYRLHAENEALRKALARAADDIESWGAYADEYFKQKHNLQGDIDHARAAMKEKP